MKKANMPDFRLAVVGRVLQRLSLSDEIAALTSVSRYVRENSSRFGVAKNAGSDLDPEEYADLIIAKAGALGHPHYDHNLKVALAAYLASMLGTDHPRINALMYLAIASVDDVIRNVAMLASFGHVASRTSYGLPYRGLSLLMEGDDTAATDREAVAILKAEEYVSTNFVRPIAILTSTNALTGLSTVHEHPPCRTPEDTVERNGIALNERIVMALRRVIDQDVQILPSTETPDRLVTAKPGLLDLLCKASENASCGVHVAYRTGSPADQACQITDQILANGTPAILINESEANSALISILCGQILAFHETHRNRANPIIVVHDEWELVTAWNQADEIAQAEGLEPGMVETGYDTDLMTAQKRLLHIVSGRGFAPMLWIIPELVPISQPLVGMFSDIAALPVDNQLLRAAQIERMAAGQGVTIDPVLLRRISGYPGDVSELAGAIRAASVAGHTDDLDRACRAVLSGSGLARTMPVRTPSDFDIRLVEARATMIDETTGAIVRENTIKPMIEKFITKRHRPIKILFYGDPGTSKTSLARYIAECMGMDLVEMKPSAVLTKWVGDTEKAMQAKFAEAVAKNQFLLIDEVDSFLQHRESSKNSWEKTSTNEMLTQLQQHPIPMGCTTNFIDSIDKAALRRFLFKIEVRPLNAERARIAWVSMLKMHLDDCPTDHDLQGLTVSDFATVAEQMQVLEIKNPVYAKAALLEERRSRGEEQKRPIGFTAR